MFSVPRRSQATRVIEVIDAALTEEAKHQGLYSKPGDPNCRNPQMAAIHPRDLPPKTREILIEEVRKILGEGG